MRPRASSPSGGLYRTTSPPLASCVGERSIARSRPPLPRYILLALAPLPCDTPPRSAVGADTFAAIPLIFAIASRTPSHPRLSRPSRNPSPLSPHAPLAQYPALRARGASPSPAPRSPTYPPPRFPHPAGPKRARPPPRNFEAPLVPPPALILLAALNLPFPMIRKCRPSTLPISPCGSGVARAFRS